MAMKELETFLEGIENNDHLQEEAEYGYLIDPVIGETIAPATKEEKELSDEQGKEQKGDKEHMNMIEIHWKDLVGSGRITRKRAMELRKRQNRTKKIKGMDMISAWVKPERGE
jgi:hypothetical protein